MRVLVQIEILTMKDIFVICERSNNRMHVYFSINNIYKLDAFNIEYKNVHFINSCLFNKSLFLY